MGRWPHALPRWLWRDSGFRYSLLPKWLPPPAADAAAPQQEDNGHLPVVGAEGMQCNSEVPRWAYPPVLQLWNRAQKWHFQYQRLQVDIAQRGSLCRTAEARVIYISRLRQEEQPLVTIYQECTRGLLKLHWSILQTNTEFRPHVYAVQQPFPPPPNIISKYYNCFLLNWLPQKDTILFVWITPLSSKFHLSLVNNTPLRSSWID